MSKMSQIHAEMTEKVNELGYETVEEAIADGWDSAEFYASYIDDEQTKAHEEWLREKEIVLGDLKNLLIGMGTAGKSDTTEFEIVRHAIEFIEGGEH